MLELLMKNKPVLKLACELASEPTAAGKLDLRV